MRKQNELISVCLQISKDATAAVIIKKWNKSKQKSNGFQDKCAGVKKLFGNGNKWNENSEPNNQLYL